MLRPRTGPRFSLLERKSYVDTFYPVLHFTEKWSGRLSARSVDHLEYTRQVVHPAEECASPNRLRSRQVARCRPPSRPGGKYHADSLQAVAALREHARLRTVRDRGDGGDRRGALARDGAGGHDRAARRRAGRGQGGA